MNEATTTPLAIHGGQPAWDIALPPWPLTQSAIRKSIDAVLKDDSWAGYRGQVSEDLKAQLREKANANDAWTCCSGTVGIELALRGTNTNHGEVILAAFDFPGNFRAIEAVGGRPVLVDLANSTLTIDLAAVLDAINEQTTAVILSHLYGQTVDLVAAASEIRRVAPSIALIEDACQSPFCQPLSEADASVISFGGTKILTAGRGGAVMSNDPRVAQRIKIFAERASNDAFPLSNLQAAALLPQLEELPSLNERRLASLQELRLETSMLNCLQLLESELSAGAIYKIPLRVNSKFRDFAIKALQAEGIVAGTPFPGFVQRSPARCRKMGDLPNTRSVVEELFVIHHPVLTTPGRAIQKLACGLQKVDRYIDKQME